MNDTKPFWQSKTVIAGVVTIVLAVLAALGVGAAESDRETITEFILQIVTALAGLIAVVGRLTATKELRAK